MAWMRSILGAAVLAVALFSAPVHGLAMDGHEHGEQGAPEAHEAAHGDHAAEGGQPMAADEHDHEGMMEQAGQEVGIDEKLGNRLADVTFRDAEGNEVNLLELTRDVPTIMIPIYYRCPDVCNVLQGSFASILPDVKLKPGEEIQVVSISFDPHEGVKQAARAKQTYLAAAGGEYPGEHWKFLVGDEAAVAAWLDSIGYSVKREGGLWAHPVAVLAIAPGGKVVRYLYGSSFLPFDITMAGTEAASGKIGLSVKRLLSMCYSYDPEGRRYVFSILRVSGIAIFTFVGGFILYLVLSGRKHKNKET